MGIAHARPIQQQTQLRRRAAPTSEEELPAHSAPENGIVDLQRMIGNSGVQRLLAQGRLQPRHAGLPLAGGLTHHLQRRCACCNGIHDEQEDQAVGSPAQSAPVQRFWDDEEESSDEGGGFMDWVSDTASDVGEEVGSWFGGDEEETGGGDHEGGGWSSETDSGDASEAEDGSWWQEGDESETVTEEEGDEGGWEDWLPWNWGDSEDSETPQEIPAVSAECETDEGVGFGSGSGKKISLHGKTDANYNHGKPIPAPFPSTITVTTATKGKTNVFSASGTFDATYKASPTVTLPPVPSGLTSCQEEAVRKFINGPLSAHEQEHVKAFKDNYDGAVTLSVNVSNIIDTPTMRQRAMENPVNTEDQKRTKAANAASKALDPWKKTVPGLDCKG